VSLSPCWQTTTPSRARCSAKVVSLTVWRTVGIHISSSTISVALSEPLATAHAKAGQRFVAAPVFGRPDVAAAGQLFVVAAGSADALAAATPLFDAIG